MATHKRLNSVSHSIAHHAVSGLSYLHPHLCRACKLENLNSVTVELLEENPYPKCLQSCNPLELALLALKEKLSQILISEGYSLSELTSAKLRFEFEPSFKDDYCSNCCAQLTAKSGKSYEAFVGWLGSKIIPETSVKL